MTLIEVLKQMLEDTRKDDRERLCTSNGVSHSQITIGDFMEVDWTEEQRFALGTGAHKIDIHTHPVEVSFSDRDLEAFNAYPTLESMLVILPSGEVSIVERHPGIRLVDSFYRHPIDIFDKEQREQWMKELCDREGLYFEPAFIKL